MNNSVWNVTSNSNLDTLRSAIELLILPATGQLPAHLPH